MNDKIISVKELLNYITLNNIPMDKLLFVPDSTNYSMSRKIFDNGKKLWEIVEISTEYGSSYTKLSDHLSVINPRDDCFLKLSPDQVEYLEKLAEKYKNLI